MVLYPRGGPAQTCCHTEIEAADQTGCLNQSRYTDTGPTSPCADPKTPGGWQVASGVPVLTSPVTKRPAAKVGFEPGSAALEEAALPPGQREGGECHATDHRPHNFHPTHKCSANRWSLFGMGLSAVYNLYSSHSG